MSDRSFDSHGGITSFYSASLLPSLDQSPPVQQYNNSRTQPLSAAPMMASPIRTKKPAASRSLLTTNWSAAQSPSSQPSTPTSSALPVSSVLRPVSTLSEQIRHAQSSPVQVRSHSHTSSAQHKHVNLYSHHSTNFNRLPPRPVFTHSSRSVPSSAQSSPSNSELSSPLSSSLASFVAPAHHDDIAPHTCDLLGKAGESNTNSAFLVRSRVDGKLSIFKPADGEAFEEAVASRQHKNARMHIRTTDSPSCSPSHSPFPSEPTTPMSPSPCFSLDGPKTPMRKGVVWGDCALKEKAVFVLDSPDHFSGVPRSDAVRIMIPRNTDDIPVIDPTTVQVSVDEEQPEIVSVPPTPRPSQSQPIAIPNAANTRSIISRHQKNYSFGRYIDSIDRDDSGDDSDEDFHESNHDLVEVYGSLQEFIPHIGSADDVGSSLFSADDVHRIGILDVRILNLDRHHGNMLVKRDSKGFFHLVPIDHGYVLPSYQELSDVHLEWTYWKQAAVPFSKASLDYIASLNPLADATKLRALGIRAECIISMVFATLLMQHGAARGLTLQQIARLVQREKKSIDDAPLQTSTSDAPLDISTEPSSLERIVARVTRRVIKERLPLESGDNSSEFVLLPLSGFERTTSTQMLLPSPSSSSQMSSPSPSPSPAFGPLSSSLAVDTQSANNNNSADINLFLIIQAIHEEIESVFPAQQQPLAITPTAASPQKPSDY